jgi:hypothetical protein
MQRNITYSVPAILDSPLEKETRQRTDQVDCETKENMNGTNNKATET